MPNTRKTGDNNEFFITLYEAARTYGEASNEVVETIKAGKLNWKDPHLVAQASMEFRLGRIAGMLRLDQREEALAIVQAAKSKRTAVEQKAFHAAAASWSNIALVAGMPNRYTGAPRKKRATASSKSNGDLARVTVFSVPQAKTIDEVKRFADHVAEMLVTFEKRNRGLKMNGYRKVFDSFIADVKTMVHEVAERPVARSVAKRGAA